jgi:hypothetical protein
MIRFVLRELLALANQRPNPSGVEMVVVHRLQDSISNLGIQQLVKSRVVSNPADCLSTWRISARSVGTPHPTKHLYTRQRLPKT